MRVRHFGNHKTTGRFSSLKMGGMVHWESSLELDFFYILENDPDVLEYYEQPEQISYRFDSKNRKYTPDVLVLRKDKKELVEVKPSSRLLDEDNLRKFAAARIYCEKKGYEFIVVTEVEIRFEPYLNNIKTMYRYARAEVTFQHRLAMQRIIRHAGGRIGIDELAGELNNQMGRGEHLQYIYALIYDGFLRVDFNLLLTKESIVQLKERR